MTSVTCRIPAALGYLINCTNYLLSHVMLVSSSSSDITSALCFSTLVLLRYGKDDDTKSLKNDMPRICGATVNFMLCSLSFVFSSGAVIEK